MFVRRGMSRMFQDSDRACRTDLVRDETLSYFMHTRPRKLTVPWLTTS